MGDERLPLLYESHSEAILTISHAVHYKAHCWVESFFLPFTLHFYPYMRYTILRGYIYRPKKYPIHGPGPAIVKDVLCMPLRCFRSLIKSSCMASSAPLSAGRWGLSQTPLHSLP